MDWRLGFGPSVTLKVLSLIWGFYEGKELGLLFYSMISQITFMLKSLFVVSTTAMHRILVALPHLFLFLIYT